MKASLCLLLLMTMPALAQRGGAQEAASPDTTIYEVNSVEKKPEYSGGIEQLVWDTRVFVLKYKKEHFPDPETNPYWWPDGIGLKRSIVKFIVHEDGRITDVVLVRSAEPHSDRAALFFVKSMPRWTPGEHKGHKVKVRYTLPFTMRVQ